MPLYNLPNNNQYLSITDHPALNQKALDSVDRSNILPAHTTIAEQKKNSLMELIKACREKYEAELPKYNRKAASKLLGYPGKPKFFTMWLRDNNFITWDDYPESSLIDRGLMDVHQKDIYSQVQYDCCSRPVSGNEYEGATRIKSVYTPLFTEKGISFFKALLADEKNLKEEVEKIRLINHQIQYS